MTFFLFIRKDIFEMNLIENIKEIVSNIFRCGSRLSYDGWECIFEDKFEGINENTWSPCVKGKSNWNRFMTERLPEVHNENGLTFVRLECNNDFENNTFVTEGITSKDKHVFPAGRVEVRARFNPGNSTWPAIWMVNNGNTSQDEYYEIDLCEYFNTRNYVNVTYHCPSSLSGKKKPIRRVSWDFNKDEWNDFVCEFDESVIKVYVNRKLVLTVRNNENQRHFPVNLKDRFFFLILSMQYAYPGTIKPDITELPLWMDVQYVRYWRRS